MKAKHRRFCKKCKNEVFHPSEWRKIDKKTYCLRCYNDILLDKIAWAYYESHN